MFAPINSTLPYFFNSLMLQRVHSKWDKPGTFTRDVSHLITEYENVCRRNSSQSKTQAWLVSSLGNSVRITADDAKRHCYWFFGVVRKTKTADLSTRNRFKTFVTARCRFSNHSDSSIFSNFWAACRGDCQPEHQCFAEDRQVFPKKFGVVEVIINYRQLESSIHYESDINSVPWLRKFGKYWFIACLLANISRLNQNQLEIFPIARALGNSRKVNDQEH